MLRFFLLANCASCAIFGFLFVALTQESVAFIGTPPAIVVAGLGILLLINAALLALTVRRWQNTPAVIMFFVVGDVGWVVLTFGCLVSGLWIHGTTSTLASVLIAACVGGLGYGQFLFGVKGKSA